MSHYRVLFDDIMLLPKPFLLARWLTSGCATEPRHYTLTLPTFWQTHTYCLSSGSFFFFLPSFSLFEKKIALVFSFLLSQHTRTFLSPPRFFPPSRKAALTFWTASLEWRGGGGTTVGPPVLFSHKTPTQTPVAPFPFPSPPTFPLVPGVLILAGAC